jgi:hypothetical protein
LSDAGENSSNDDSGQIFVPLEKVVSGDFAFENGQRVPVVQPDFAELDHASEIEQLRNASDYQREKLGEVLRFIFAVLLDDLPSAAQVGRRAYLLAWILNQTPFETQSELADHLQISHGRLSQELNKILSENPMLTGIRGASGA